MKKTLLSVVLCVAVLLSTVSAMLVMPASAAESNLLAAPMAPNDGGAATFAYEGGVLTINATKDGDEVGITPETAMSIIDQPYIDLAIESTVDFNAVFYDKSNEKWMWACQDFCNLFGENIAAGDAKIPAGTYTVRIDLSGAYTWTGDPVPENAKVDFVSIIAKGAGTIKVTELTQTDGMTSTNINSASYADNADWQASGLLKTDASAWGSANAEVDGTVSSAVVGNNGTALTVTPSAGLWPAATLDYDAPIVADWGTSAIEVSYSIATGGQGRVILFYGDSNNANFDSNEVVDLGPVAKAGSDLDAGHYNGIIMLKDIIPEESVAEDGTVKLNGVKIFAVGDKACTTVNALNLLSVKKVDTGIDVTTPTVAPNGGNSGSTTTNPGTGDSTNAVVFAVVAALAAGVVTLSVVSKKVRAR